MSDLVSILTSIFVLLGTASFIVIIALATSSFSFKFAVARKSLILKLVIGFILGGLAIYATLMGTRLADGTIINVRELAAMIAGVAGGPIAGTIAGLIGGFHRYTVGGATALPCTISTIVIGLVSGIASTKLLGRMYLLKGAALGFILESGAMGLILLLVQPFSVAASIVSQIAVPMIAANTIGLTLWMYLFNKWSKPTINQ